MSRSESFFPLEISCPRIEPDADYGKLKEWAESILQRSSERCVNGYDIRFNAVQSRRYGQQSIPVAVIFQDEAQYLRFLGREHEVESLRAAIEETIERLPEINPWMNEFPGKVLPYCSDWSDILTVCRYFLENAQPHLFVRELPLSVHTKFIEEHREILRELLDYLLPAECVNRFGASFEERFSLKTDEPLLRFRLLDGEFQSKLHWPASDLSIPLSACKTLPFENHTVVITENKICFLTLPALPNTIGIWGGGFKVNLFRSLEWLGSCKIIYWGDIDSYGFEILSMLRSFLPKVESVFMDLQTMAAYEPYIVRSPENRLQELPGLTSVERSAYAEVTEKSIRLEQERIAVGCVGEKLRSIVSY